MSGQTTKAKGSVKERIIRFKEDVVTWIVMGMLRPFNRHKMVNLDSNPYTKLKRVVILFLFQE